MVFNKAHYKAETLTLNVGLSPTVAPRTDFLRHGRTATPAMNTKFARHARKRPNELRKHVSPEMSAKKNWRNVKTDNRIKKLAIEILTQLKRALSSDK